MFKYIKYDEEPNGDGTYKTTLYFDGYYDDEGFHQRECGIVLPRVQGSITKTPNEYEITADYNKVLFNMWFKE